MDNRTKVWLGGLTGFLLLASIAAYVVGGKENVELLTLSTGADVVDGSDELGAAGIGDPGDVIIDGVNDDGEFVTSTVAAIPSAVPFATSTPFPTPTPLPTATPTPIPTLVAEATTEPEATAVPEQTAVPDEAEPEPTSDVNGSGTLADEATVEAVPTVSGISTPVPFGTTPTPLPTPSGPGAFRVREFEAAGASVIANTISVKINENGTGTAVGELAINWPDGRSVRLNVDDAFTFPTNYRDIRVGINAKYDLDAPGEADDVNEVGGTMRIPDQILRVGAICSKVCFTFDY